MSWLQTEQGQQVASAAMQAGKEASGNASGQAQGAISTGLSAANNGGWSPASQIQTGGMQPISTMSYNPMGELERLKAFRMR